MQRFFIEVAYLGTGYAGFQRQENARTIQSEIEDALSIYYRTTIELTGSSRTDAGVHALQNYFHGDFPVAVQPEKDVYHLNAILPGSVVIKRMIPVGAEAHSRFHATSRSYRYVIYTNKNPFLDGRAYYFPFKLDIDKMQEAAQMLMLYQDFEAFSKKNSQVHTHQCEIMHSRWVQEAEQLVYEVTANRFLRGMVRALTATMLKVGRGKMSLEEFRALLEGRKLASAEFSAPAHGLYLARVSYQSEGPRWMV